MRHSKLSDEAIRQLTALAEQENISVNDMIDNWYVRTQKNGSPNLFQALFDTARQAILVVDEDGNYIDANAMACELLGYNYDELMTLSVTDIVEEEDIRHQSVQDDFYKNGYINSIYRVRRKDGNTIYVEFSSVANVLEGVHVAFVRNATEYVRIISSLEENERYIQAIYHNSDVPLFSVDVSESGEFTYHELSKKHLKALKKSRAEVIGKRIDEVDTVYADDAERLLNKYRRCYDLGKAINYEEQFSIDGKAIMWKTYLTPLRNENGRIYRLIGASYDLSDRFAFEREQLRAELLDLELAKAQELSIYKAQVTSMLAHEFQTPLSVINTSIYLLRNNVNNVTPTMIEERLKRIDRQVTLLRSLMERMIGLNYGAVMQQDLQLVNIDFPKFSQDIFDDLAMSFPDSSPIAFNYDIEDPIILTDEELIRQIITNLTSNAMKYSPSKSPVKVHCAINQSFFNITVSDQGIGIPAEELETIFDFFHRGTNVENRQGIGVGLMVVQQAVNRLGGRINIDSEEGQGTTVTVTLSAKAIQNTDV